MVGWWTTKHRTRTFSSSQGPDCPSERGNALLGSSRRSGPRQILRHGLQGTERQAGWARHRGPPKPLSGRKMKSGQRITLTQGGQLMDDGIESRALEGPKPRCEMSQLTEASVQPRFQRLLVFVGPSDSSRNSKGFFVILLL